MAASRAADGFVAAGTEQRGDLAGIHMAASRQGAGLDVGHVGHAGECFGVDETEAPSFLDRAAHGGEHMVDGCGLGTVVDQHRAQGGDVLIADCGPIDHEATGSESAGQYFGGAGKGTLQAAAADGRCAPGKVDGGRVAVEAPRYDYDGHVLGHRDRRRVVGWQVVGRLGRGHVALLIRAHAVRFLLRVRLTARDTATRGSRTPGPVQRTVRCTGAPGVLRCQTGLPAGYQLARRAMRSR